MKQAASQAGDDKRKPLYGQANDLVRQHVPMVPVVHGGSAVAFKADVKDAHTSPLGNEIFADMDPGGRDTFVWMQNAEPGSLYCGDETDGESLRACNMVTEGLLAYEKGGTKTVPALATSCDPNEDLTVWTCKLRENVKFHDGSDFDANDVVMTYYRAVTQIIIERLPLTIELGLSALIIATLLGIPAGILSAIRACAADLGRVSTFKR